MKRMDFFVSSGPIAILLTYVPAESSITTIYIAKNMVPLPDLSAILFEIAKQFIIMHSTENMVPVCTLQADLQYLSQHPNASKLFNSAIIRNGPYHTIQIELHLDCEVLDKIEKPSQTYGRCPLNQLTGIGRSFLARRHYPSKAQQCRSTGWGKGKSKCWVTA